MQRTLAQKRSEYALENLKVAETERKDFATLAQGLPPMILQNGLGHSLSFLLSKATDKDLIPKKSDKHYIAFQLIAGWLTTREILKDSTPPKVMASLSTMKQEKYLDGQTETLKLLEWVKRYAKAGLFILPDGGSNGTTAKN